MTNLLKTHSSWKSFAGIFFGIFFCGMGITLVATSFAQILPTLAGFIFIALGMAI